MLSFQEIEENMNQNKIQRDIVKIQTNTWVNSKKELVVQKTIRQMRSLSESSTGYLAFEDELSQVGVDALGTSFPDLTAFDDGLYQMTIAWCSRDIETGYIDDIEFKFTKIDEGETK
tara:strand:+ start:48831 stop:49181 length:351 start_codon:yes stop_codon:yes gene_type:complete